MRSSSDESGNYGCGYCMSPSCVYNEVRGGGECPFYNRQTGYGEKEIRERVQKINDIPRGSPMLQEVSPCTESGMYTIEGILRDPEEFDRSAVFDPETLGRLLEAAPFQKMKWSPQLGYGMGHRPDGSRVHLHSRGKIIIRKAPGRREADRMFYSLTSLARPALLSIKGGFILWEALFLNYHDGDRISRGDLDPYLKWGQKDGDPVVMIDSSEDAYRELDEKTGDEFRSQIIEILENLRGIHQGPDEIESLKERLSGTWRDFEKDGFEDEGRALGTRVFFLSATRSISGLEMFLDQDPSKWESDLREITDRIMGVWAPNRSEISLKGLDIGQLDASRGLMQCTYFLMPFGRGIWISANGR
ncbi:MAG: hypothetical protein ACMUIG_08045 [Thermoplasmatota archaeon]